MQCGTITFEPGTLQRTANAKTRVPPSLTNAHAEIPTTSTERSEWASGYYAISSAQAARIKGRGHARARSPERAAIPRLPHRRAREDCAARVCLGR